jgi:hypothetical protein
VTVAGADWRIDPAVKYGLQIALNTQIFFN